MVGGGEAHSGRGEISHKREGEGYVVYMCTAKEISIIRKRRGDVKIILGLLLVVAIAIILYGISLLTTSRVLVCAVDKSNLPLKLNFFNNCFDDQFSHGMFIVC